jgi:hypothetical protein
MLLGRSFNIGVAAPRHTALNGVLESGNPRFMNRDSLAGMLGRWSGLMAELAVDAGHLERNRDVDLQAALVEIGVPGLAGAASAAELGLLAAAFLRIPTALCNSRSTLNSYTVVKQVFVADGG